MQLINKGRILRTFDKDALAIINTIRDVDSIILTQDERWYVNHIVSGFKAIGVWTKIKALYGFVGGTAATHKWNWKDMRDLDGAFRLTFPNVSTAWSFSTKGTKSISTAGTDIINTHIPASSLFYNNVSLGIYITEYVQNGSSSDLDIGVNQDDNITRNLYLTVGFSSNASIISAGKVFSSSNILNGNRTGRGYGCISRLGTTILLLNNNNIINTSPTLGNSNTFASGLVGIGGGNGGDGAVKTLKTYGFAYIGEGLTQQQALQMSHIITTAQSILGRK